MSRQPLFIVSLVLALGAFAGSAYAGLAEAEQALREGRYEDAVSAFADASVSTPTPRLYKGWIEALRLTGHFDDAPQSNLYIDAA